VLMIHLPVGCGLRKCNGERCGQDSAKLHLNATFMPAMNARGDPA
jgi:hypothetical protein